MGWAGTPTAASGIGAVMKLLGFAGALRRASTNRGMLRAAARVLPDGVELTIAEIGDIPLYDMDRDPFGGDAGGAPNRDGTVEYPPSVARLRAQVTEADGLLAAVGVNNFSIPAPLANALAWLSRPEMRGEEKVRILKGKTWALLSSGGGSAGADGREAFAKSVGATGGVVIEESVDVKFFEGDFDLETGDVVSSELTERIRGVTTALVHALS